MSLRIGRIYLDASNDTADPKGVLFDTESQTVLPLVMKSPTEAHQFLMAVERSGVDIGHYTPLVELRASYRLWSDAYKR